MVIDPGYSARQVSGQPPASSGHRVGPTSRCRPAPLYPIGHNGCVKTAEDGPRRTLAGSLLADARRRARLTQVQLAERSGLVRPLISPDENGRKDPAVSMLARLVEACGMELRMRADLLTEAERDQRRRDATLGFEAARRNAVRARREVISVRRPSPSELAGMRSAQNASA